MSEPRTERSLLCQSSYKVEKPTRGRTVQCPLCGEAIEIPEHNHITKNDALLEHLAKNCSKNR